VRYALLACGLALSSLAAAGRAAAQTIQWPVAAPRVVQDYGCFGCAGRPQPGFHTGIDITDATQSCVTNSVPVYPALAGGTVYRIYTGCVAGVTPADTNCGQGFGNHVLIQHRGVNDPLGPLYSLYAHLRSVSVNVGDQPGSSAALGIMGATGSVQGCHVHFGLLDFTPPYQGSYNPQHELPRMGFDGYLVSTNNSAYPATDCDLANANHGCLDPKGFVSLTMEAVTGSVSALERPGQSQNCVAQLDAGEAYASIAQVNLGGQVWQYLMLPSKTPATAQGGTASCVSSGIFGWVPAAQSSTAGQFVTVAGAKLNGTGLAVKSQPAWTASDLTYGWDGEVFWASATSPPSGPCSQPWYQISVPATRAGGATSGWVCGDDLTLPGKGTIEVDVTLEGQPWPGNVSYSLEGPQTIAGTTAASYVGVTPGGYSIQYLGGGPSPVTAPSITPPASQLLAAGGRITWALDFTNSCAGGVAGSRAAGACSGGLLSLSLAGTGAGRVISNPSGIDCPSVCRTIFSPLGTQVVLSPIPSPGSIFAGWSGDPACATGIVTMNGNYACTATFTASAPAYTLAVGETGSGTVSTSDGGIVCGGICSQAYVSGTTVTLAATAASGWSFSSWSGSCSGGPVVQLAMTGNMSCTANFTQNPQTTPVTTTGAATNVTASSATLNGTINPENFAATAYFEYGPDPNLGNATPGVSFGPGNNAFFPYAQTVTGLACATNYRFRAVGVGTGGAYRASNNNFVTSQCPPAPCYALNLIANGDAPAPIPYPANASGCPNGQYHAGDRIALTAVMVPGDVVTGWGGTDNDASTAASNTVTMTQPYNRAVYTIEQHVCYHLSLADTGQGSVPVATNPVASCPANYFPWGYEVDVSGASPAVGWQIGGWSGTENDGATIGQNFVLMPTHDQTVLVLYVPVQDQLSVTTVGNGTGTITSEPPGINCGATCSALFPYGSTVNLAATPDPGSTFLGFSGGVCNGGMPTMTAATTCTAVFGVEAPPPTKFYTLPPCRVVDTRDPNDPNSPAIQAGETRLPAVAGNCGVPSTAQAVSLNLTVVNASASGSLTLGAVVKLPASTSTISFQQGWVRANNAIVSLNPEGGLAVYCGMTSGSVDYIIDVNGYFQ
jgi:hypothetical protein